MAKKTTPSKKTSVKKPVKKRTTGQKIFRFFWLMFLWFNIISFSVVLLFKFIPVPFTPLMGIRAMEHKKDNKDKKEKYKYTGIYFWNPPSEWKSVLRSGFYGKYIRSGMYTRSGEGDRIAQWTAELAEGAYYDLYCHIEKINIEWNREKRKSNYNFKIYHDDGMDDITLADEELENGWNYMGTFYISPENAKVELTNKSVGKMVFADAIKWVKNE